MTAIGVLGGGPWGVSLARAARHAGSEVTLCTRRDHPALPGVRVTPSMRVLAEARLLVVAVPSSSVRAVARELGDFLDGGHVLVHGIRGLSSAAGGGTVAGAAPTPTSADDIVTISQVLREETPVRRIGALGGPVQASELNDGRPSAMVVGSEFPEVVAAVKRAFAAEWLKIEGTSDLRGLEWASALVGCLSIGVGFAAHIGATPGLLAALASRGVDEAAGIARAAGADPQTLYGLGGYGDLLASIVLAERPEVVLGRALARGAPLEAAQAEAALRIEAVTLVPRILRFAELRRTEHAIFTALAEILNGSQAEATLRRLFD
ncbi:MAG: glycerol-3-phosphate dehydrogenase [Myxococcales bacterium]|nr:glycerol-3-phosphate dehydrogenase [Myxococcales bacterium]